MAIGERIIRYDPSENVLSVSFRGVHLQTPEELAKHFDEVIGGWRVQAQGRKVYWLVDYEDFTVDIRLNEPYTQHMRRVFDETALTIVRYGGSALQQAAVHLYSLRLHKNANVYRTREEALEVIQRLKAGTLKYG